MADLKWWSCESGVLCWAKLLSDPYKFIVRQMGEITCNSGEVFLSFVLLGLRWKCEGTGLTAVAAGHLPFGPPLRGCVILCGWSPRAAPGFARGCPGLFSCRPSGTVAVEQMISRSRDRRLRHVFQADPVYLAGCRGIPCPKSGRGTRASADINEEQKQILHSAYPTSWGPKLLRSG